MKNKIIFNNQLFPSHISLESTPLSELFENSPTPFKILIYLSSAKSFITI